MDVSFPSPPAFQGPVQYGSLPLPSRYLLSPLAGFTNLSFRRVVHELGGVGLTTTDLVNARGLLTGSPKTLSMIETCPAERPFAVQIFGGEPSILRDAAQFLQERGVDSVDINMGCPVDRITKNGAGASMMCRADATISLVRQVVEAVSIPVTVKMRLGLGQHSDHRTEVRAGIRASRRRRRRHPRPHARTGIHAGTSTATASAAWSRRSSGFPSSATGTSARSPTRPACWRRPVVPAFLSAAGPWPIRGFSTNSCSGKNGPLRSARKLRGAAGPLQAAIRLSRGEPWHSFGHRHVPQDGPLVSESNAGSGVPTESIPGRQDGGRGRRRVTGH